MSDNNSFLRFTLDVYNTSDSNNLDDNNWWSIKAKLTTLKLTAYSDATSSDDNITIERIWGSWDKTYATSHTAADVDWELVTMNMSSWDNVNEEIENWSSAYYVIKTTVSGLSDTTQKYVQVKLNWLDDWTNVKYSTDKESWEDDSDTTVDASFDALNLKNVSSIDAPKVSQ